MQIQVQPYKAEEPRYKNVFIAEVDYMSDDADHTETMEVVVGPEQHNVENWYALVAQMRAIATYYRPHDSESDYNQWGRGQKNPVGDLTFTELFQEFWHVEDNGYIEEWPRDITCTDVYAAFEGFELFYHDHLGRRCNVKVVW